MPRFKKPKIDELLSNRNTPFINDFNITVSSFNLRNQYYKNDKGELINVVREADQMKSVKLYIDSKKRLLIASLSGSACKIFTWIQYESETGKDYIIINKERCKTENSLSENTYKKAIIELISKNLLYKEFLYKDTYWFHPDMFFNGDRIKKYPSNLVLLRTKEDVIDNMLTFIDIIDSNPIKNEYNKKI